MILVQQIEGGTVLAAQMHQNVLDIAGHLSEFQTLSIHLKSRPTLDYSRQLRGRFVDFPYRLGPD